ncbi:MAG: hypothetical protein NZT92_03490 [Abditibacteriales bacterium]|nr:hypothetical protein [Abditibacteriales bacterium]MDW8365865.1 hypothetical protein [Abditibacteriales bacterium]
MTQVQTTSSLSRLRLVAGDRATNAAMLMELVHEQAGFADARGLPQVHWFADFETWEEMRRARGKRTRQRIPRPFYSPEAHAIYLPPSVTQAVTNGFSEVNDLDGLVSVLHELLHGARYATMRSLRAYLVEGLTEGFARYLACEYLTPPRVLLREEVNALLADGNPLTELSVQTVEVLASLTQPNRESARQWLCAVVRSEEPQTLLQAAVAHLLSSSAPSARAERVLRIPTLLSRVLHAAQARDGLTLTMGEVWYPDGITVW